jgi:hypothetical protein
VNEYLDALGARYGSALDRLDIECFLIIFCGGSSSSSLMVRSITSLAGLLFDLGAEDPLEGSREDMGGVAPNILALASAFKLGILSSCISIRSPSSSFSGVGLLYGLLGASACFCRCQAPLGSMVTCSVLEDVDLRIPSTYRSIVRLLKGAEWLHIGHVHCGACSCNIRYDAASKHWLCAHDIERQGVAILIADNGHLSDRTEDVAWISLSSALLVTTVRQQLIQSVWLAQHTLFDDSLLGDCFARLQLRNETFDGYLSDKIDY